MEAFVNQRWSQVTDLRDGIVKVKVGGFYITAEFEKLRLRFPNKSGRLVYINLEKGDVHNGQELDL